MPASVPKGIIVTVSTKTPGIINEYILVAKASYYLNRSKNILPKTKERECIKFASLDGKTSDAGLTILTMILSRVLVIKDGIRTGNWTY
jgi:hypothetical protein